MAAFRIEKKRLMVTIGQEARVARKALGLTQEDAGERIGISPHFYAHIERGNALPSVPTFYQMTIALQVGAQELLGLNFDESSDGAGELPDSNSGQGDAVADPAAVRRLIRRLRKASPAALRSVARLLRDLERAERRGGS